jgi:hypothetical protein
LGKNIGHFYVKTQVSFILAGNENLQ